MREKNADIKLQQSDKVELNIAVQRSQHKLIDLGDTELSVSDTVPPGFRILKASFSKPLIAC